MDTVSQVKARFANLAAKIGTDWQIYTSPMTCHHQAEEIRFREGGFLKVFLLCVGRLFPSASQKFPTKNLDLVRFHCG